MDGSLRCLIVEDDLTTARGVCSLLEEWGATATMAAGLAAGLELLKTGPNILILDIGLPDGSGITLAKAAAALRPVPLMIAISGTASGMDGFEVAKHGVMTFLPKPFGPSAFMAAFEGVLTRPNAVPWLEALVGRQKMDDILERVRKALVEHALALTGNNRTAAAQLLGVTRQAVQYLIRDLDIEVPESTSPSRRK